MRFTGDAVAVGWSMATTTTPTNAVAATDPAMSATRADLLIAVPLDVAAFVLRPATGASGPREQPGGRVGR